MKKRNIRNKKIYRTLIYSKWFLAKRKEIKEKYKASGNDESLLNLEVKKLSRFLPTYWENRIRNFIKTGKLEIPTIGAHIIYYRNWKTDEQELSIRIYKKQRKKIYLKFGLKLKNIKKSFGNYGHQVFLIKI